MSPKGLDSRHSIESCTFQLHTWKPFRRCHQQSQQHHSVSVSVAVAPAKTLDPPSSSSAAAAAAANHRAYGTHGLTKRPCRSDRATAAAVADAIDFSRLSLADDDRRPYAGGSLRMLARKRRRRGSRSVSGRSSDRICSAGASAAAYGACSDFPVAVGTDSSGELFLNNNGGDGNWSSDMSEARNPRYGEKESFGGGPIGGFDPQGTESGYGSEPGYRGDAEFGYGDELDEEEDDGRLLFWGDNRFEDMDSAMEIVGENTFSDQKAHHRCRRKKHDCRMVDSVR